MDHSEVKHLPKVDHVPAELSEESKLLLAGAALIEQHGHCHDRETDDEGRLCFLGAVKKAAGGQRTIYGFNGWDAHLVGNVAQQMSGAVGGLFWRWNDSHSKDEVVAKMRAVALGL